MDLGERILVYMSQIVTLLSSSIAKCQDIILPLETYQAWLDREAETQQFQFVKTSGRKTSDYQGNWAWTEYHACHRSGAKKEHAGRTPGGKSKMTRRKSSCKIGCECRAIIKYYRDDPNNVKIRYYYEHKNHTPGTADDLRFLRRAPSVAESSKQIVDNYNDHAKDRNYVNGIAEEEDRDHYGDWRPFLVRIDQLCSDPNLLPTQHQKILRLLKDSLDALEIITSENRTYQLN